MREFGRFAKPDALPDVGQVLRAQDLPEEDALAPRLRRLLDDAMGTAAALVEPRAVWEPVRLDYTGMGADAHYLQRLGEVDPEALQGVYQRIRASGMAVCPTVITFKTGTHVRASRPEASRRVNSSPGRSWTSGSRSGPNRAICRTTSGGTGNRWSAG